MSAVSFSGVLEVDVLVGVAIAIAAAAETEAFVSVEAMVQNWMELIKAT